MTLNMDLPTSFHCGLSDLITESMDKLLILHFTFIIQHFLKRHIERRGELPASQIIVVLERQVVAASQIP